MKCITAVTPTSYRNPPKCDPFGYCAGTQTDIWHLSPISLQTPVEDPWIRATPPNAQRTVP